MPTCSNTARAGSFPSKALGAQKVGVVLFCEIVWVLNLPVQAATALVRRFILSDEDIKRDPSKFVEGWGWDHTKWAEREFPTAVSHSLFHVTT